MKLLFDTHAFIWWDSKPAQLSSTVLEMCQDPANTLMLSVVSAWEIQVKAQAGRLNLRRALKEIVSEQQETNEIELLPVHLSHVLALESLPPHHRDPFDRLLLAQALTENAVVLSRDAMLRRYDVPVVW